MAGHLALHRPRHQAEGGAGWQGCTTGSLLAGAGLLLLVCVTQCCWLGRQVVHKAERPTACICMHRAIPTSVLCLLPPSSPQIHFVNFHAKKDNSKLEALLAR